jgi:hypothetical protein
MGIRLGLARIHIPQSVRKRRLDGLFEATAAAFGTPAPTTRRLTDDQCLDVYAEFTRDQAEAVLRHGDVLDTQARLFSNARRLGNQLRAEFKVNSTLDVMRLSSLVYELIGIDFRGEPDGDITIRRCFFSTYYSGQVCRVVSSLDAGLLAGLSRGGRLVFSERLTEGGRCCRAYLDMGEELT